MKSFILEKLLSDDEIRDIYRKIHALEERNKDTAHHNPIHIRNVMDYGRKLAELIEMDPEMIDAVEIAAYLHDIGRLSVKKGHAEKSSEMARDYFEKNNLHHKYEKDILEAIALHSNGCDSDNPIVLTLILADKLDITFTRLASQSYLERGMRQLQYITDVNLDLKDGCLMIDFICEPLIDFEELQEFSFIGKMEKAVEAFCNHFGLKHRLEYVRE